MNYVDYHFIPQTIHFDECSAYSLPIEISFTRLIIFRTAVRLYCSLYLNSPPNLNKSL